MKPYPMKELLSFAVRQDHIVTGTGTARQEHYLLRLLPRNMEILSLQDRMTEEERLRAALDSSDKVIPSFFILDKTEGLTDIRTFYKAQKELNPQYDAIHSAVIRQLDGMAEESSSVERAFYMIVSVTNRSQMELFCSQIQDAIPYYLAERDELILCLRNFLLREYTTFPLAEFDANIELSYEELCRAHDSRQAKKRRPKPITVSKEALADEQLLNMLLPMRLPFNTRYAEQNDFLRKTIAVRNYPASFDVDCVLRSIGCMTGTTMRIYLRSLKGNEVSHLINAEARKTSARLKSNNKADMIRANEEQQRIQKAYEDMLSNNEKMYYVTILIEVYGADILSLNKRVETVKNLLLMHGLTKDDMIGKQRECFLSMLPFGKNRIGLSRNMPSATFAAMYPFTSSKKVDKDGLVLGKTMSGGPIIVNPFLRDELITSGNILIEGAPGQGKTYLTKKILALLMAQKISCYTFDPENEYGELYAGMGGSNIECGIGGRIINPLEVRRIARLNDPTIPDEDTPPAFSQGGALRQHLSWLRDFFAVLLPDITGRELNILSILLREHYAAYHIGMDHDPEQSKPSDYPTIGTLYEFISDVYADFNAEKHIEFQKDDLQNILLQLRDFYDGSGAALFNGITNIPDARMINFQMQTLLQGSSSRRAAVMFNIMTWIMNRVLTYREKLCFTVDELYLMLDRKHPALIVWLRNYLKRNRKYEAIAILCTQNLADFDDPEILYLTSAILQLPAYKFLFYPGDVDKQTMSRLLRLTDSEIAAISNSRKRHCLLTAGSVDKYYFKIGTLPYEKDLFGTRSGR